MLTITDTLIVKFDIEKFINQFNRYLTQNDRKISKDKFNEFYEFVEFFLLEKNSAEIVIWKQNPNKIENAWKEYWL